jgi:hypothetical protein
MPLLHNGPPPFPTGEDKTRFVFCNRIIHGQAGTRVSRDRKIPTHQVVYK